MEKNNATDRIDDNMGSGYMQPYKGNIKSNALTGKKLTKDQHQIR